jgi:hypothetical protein
VLCEAAEDETNILADLRYSAKLDAATGTRGMEAQNHEWQESELICDFGDGADTQRKMSAAAERRRGGFCRAIVVNPLLVGLPKLVLMLQCTCNGFKAAMVRDQWHRIRKLWNRKGGLGEILGSLVGHGSDGDARRESAMLADMSARGASHRPICPCCSKRPLPLLFRSSGTGAPNDSGKTPGTMYVVAWEGMTLSGAVDEHGAFALHSQDTIHNAKKLLNPMDQVARVLQIGEHVVL